MVTGFDPFFLNECDNEVIRDYGPNILQSNPSGLVALSLADTTSLGAYVQAMIVPVRYTDFDGSTQHDRGEGIIEKYIKPFITQADMIITISQAGPNDYNIDKFATARRGGGNENQNFTRIENSYALPTTHEWIETTLPQEFTKAPKVIYNWKFNGKSNPDQIKPKERQQLFAGSGGDYLSNEIFYRVAKMRKEIKPALPTGHFHISKIQLRGDLDAVKVSELLNIVKKGIEDGIKGIKK